MVTDSFSLPPQYWEAFSITKADFEYLYNYLLEIETPLTANELLNVLIKQRLKQEYENQEKKRRALGEIYRPKNKHKKGQSLIFPALEWQSGKVVDVRQGNNPDLPTFEVIKVELTDGEQREFASSLEKHILNEARDDLLEIKGVDIDTVLAKYQDTLLNSLLEGLRTNPDFVYIAGRWFPRALLLDINVGHLNLAEAVLDMAEGGPLPTKDILAQLDINSNVSPKLIEFSLDLALQEDPRFDEVGPSGEVLWFLRRLEPPEVTETPPFLRYSPVDFDRSILTPELLSLEQSLDDELSLIDSDLAEVTQSESIDKVEVRLIFPHWRAGTLPLSHRLQPIFPTAYESPRVRFWFVDADTKEKFPAWLVRQQRYLYGLKSWYEARGLIPGSIVRVRKGINPGEVLLQAGNQRSSRDWIRTALIGSDGGLVMAMLKQVIRANYDERMAIFIPDVEGMDLAWERMQKERLPFEQIVLNMTREIAKLNPQGHVHASEVYAAVNLIHRCPPGPIFAVLTTSSKLQHVGDLYYRIKE